MANLSIKNVPPGVIASLRERATANHRSLQGELLALVSQTAAGSPPTVTLENTQRAPRGHKSIEQIASEHRKTVRRPVTKGGLAVDLIRADRDAR